MHVILEKREDLDGCVTQGRKEALTRHYNLSVISIGNLDNDVTMGKLVL